MKNKTIRCPKCGRVARPAVQTSQSIAIHGVHYVCPVKRHPMFYAAKLSGMKADQAAER